MHAHTHARTHTHVQFGDDNAMLKNPNLAILSMGRSGEEGGNAIYDIVTGFAQPGGRVAQPWPRATGYVHSRTTPWCVRNNDYIMITTAEIEVELFGKLRFCTTAGTSVSICIDFQ